MISQHDASPACALNNDQFAVLNALLAEMLAFQKLDPLLQHIADIVIDITHADNALILLVDETEEYLDVVASAGSSSKQNMGVRRSFGAGFAGLAWSTQQEQYLANCDALEHTKGFWPPASQLVAVPLMSNGTVVGVAVLSAPAHQLNFRNSTGLARHLASLAGIAIVNARSREQAELELSRMRALREINTLLNDFEHEADLIESVSRTLMHVMDISRVVYFLVEDDGCTEHSNVWILNNGEITKGTSIVDGVLHEGLNGWCYRNNKVGYLPRNNDDNRVSDRIHKIRSEINIGSTLSVPITTKDRVMGVISISRDRAKRDLNESERNLFLSICSQISSALLNRELAVALQHRAFHDSLTELPNRFLFERELDQHLKDSNAATLGAVLFLDLDGFKSVNDSLGHHYGDQLLIHVSERFRWCVKNSGVIARIGGDEFAVIAPNLSNEDQAIDIANMIIESLQSSLDVNGVRVNIGVSIGISYFPKDGDTTEILIRNADEAMYQAKENGKGVFMCFDQGMADDSQRRIQLEFELRDALVSNQFLLHYQPQVDTYTGALSGVEALIRWQHPERGFISPGEFIPVAEAAGLINAIGNWVLEEAVGQLARWRNGPFNATRIAVNIAASQFILDNFSEQTLRLLEKYDVIPSLLEIEVTESIVMNDIQVVVETLNTLRSAGVRVAVDDFGTGYSSLSYLQYLPLDVLKIDRSFINRLENERTDQSVANTIMLLAKGLDLETVAEGVESAAQLKLVQQLGCTMVQGFYFATPCSAEDLHQTIQSFGALVAHEPLRMVS